MDKLGKLFQVLEIRLVIIMVIAIEGVCFSRISRYLSSERQLRHQSELPYLRLVLVLDLLIWLAMVGLP